ncbi:uncharacterized protein LACBIDRAFT_329764 [Laccaria bicolor S238N-H82]|uniref:Predicted protein n=1 Tax=Laccaria bicolor (strain S238N-H82 / ATCC MYA-4686) TaxID=486041 RepID=B0DJ55_LACBS|nr:uncharacterized protein LACBIDRAFT_329763 [Laccaria bicolor S238N-H82]XP_001884021.1 uncharacterized protein LACBIDRAFT_329764 [Laccaria bicolor S238N-H82]EDR05462.1 predicted protein [Laccaria bicolor S238N-H82]EDR05463.1 predicted protein [Laccaria bicolor S238N-H82]|eukprot:XP_001884020.1 predicted protein [Laccaria bicolor S238N-H82]
MTVVIDLAKQGNFSHTPSAVAKQMSKTASVPEWPKPIPAVRVKRYWVSHQASAGAHNNTNPFRVCGLYQGQRRMDSNIILILFRKCSGVLILPHCPHCRRIRSIQFLPPPCIIAYHDDMTCHRKLQDIQQRHAKQTNDGGDDGLVRDGERRQRREFQMTGQEPLQRIHNSIDTVAAHVAV